MIAWAAKHFYTLIAAAIGVALLLGATFYAGKMNERAAWNARQANAEQTARVTERDGAAISTQAERDALARAAKEKENADAEIEKLRAALARVPRCPVPRSVVRLLDGHAVSGAAGAAAQPQATAPPVAADASDAATVECAAVIDNCGHNRLNVCEPNERQVEEIQSFYESLRRRFNKK